MSRQLSDEYRILKALEQIRELLAGQVAAELAYCRRETEELEHSERAADLREKEIDVLREALKKAGCEE